jgi:hypothetical protein
VPAGPPAAYSRGELKGAQDAEQAGAEDVHHCGQGRREEPRICRRYFRAAGQPGQAGGDRDDAERDVSSNWIQKILSL